MFTWTENVRGVVVSSHARAFSKMNYLSVSQRQTAHVWVIKTERRSRVQLIATSARVDFFLLMDLVETSTGISFCSSIILFSFFFFVYAPRKVSEPSDGWLFSISCRERRDHATRWWYYKKQYYKIRSVRFLYFTKSVFFLVLFTRVSKLFMRIPIYIYLYIYIHIFDCKKLISGSLRSNGNQMYICMLCLC